ncbi:uncharacterized protein LOC110025088 isoform X2 [Phalaenopsis equestris]|uniref:uncharacterized protein LOC110025088 isoform X2 n=1 Tax=Phalaenopsis equestris TaxID=78828 RepID=UPI0009E22BC7|nr:uncharacterized protein LOC110025088 isoform X2 [Phalaenopsis equestris]XP_020581017.1 uncharacterized protein LOC110025088 isoform X2 [Phalaenopsis equestris]
MNTRMRTAVQAMKACPKLDKVNFFEMEKEKTNEVAEEIKLKEPGKCLSRRERKIALQQDVDKLTKKLRREENVHRALKRAFTRPLGALPRLPPYLPSYTLELLAEVAVLEEEVIRLEEKVVTFRQDLYQEAIFISTSKNKKETGSDSFYDQSEQQKAQSRLNASAISTTSPSPSKRRSLDGNHHHFPSIYVVKENRLPKKHDSSLSEEHRGKENQPKNQAADKVRKVPTFQNPSDKKSCKELSGPNKLSEEILRCLLSIFSRISLAKNAMAMESEFSPSVSASSEGLGIQGSLDPYSICSQFGRRDVGPYQHLHELEASSIDPNLISNSLFLTQRLKLLLKKLSSVDVSELTHQQKLAFWINIYNSCIMNAFLENGIPTTPQMVVEQMLKAMVNVGGHILSAMNIEHFILRLPYYSKHYSLERLRSDEKTRRAVFRLDWPEPLVTFALSCGSWSSPTVRVYTAMNVQHELEEAKKEYLQAAVGILKPNRLAIPKLLDWYLLDFAEDFESLMDWICFQLPPELRTEAFECLQMSRFVIPHAIQILPYEFRFRYLFVP